jgi:hypothetical protein
MAETLCINLINMGSLGNDQGEITEGNEDAIKTLTDIVPDNAEESTAEDVIEGADAEGEEGVEGYIDAIPEFITEITTYTRDLESSSDEIPTTANASDLTPDCEAGGYGDFTNYAARQLYQDISTAFTQRTLVGMELGLDAAGQPEAALNHYLTVAIISFVNRLSITAVEATDTVEASISVMTLDEDGV